MYAITFDLKTDDLKKNYGEPYNKAYDELRQELEKLNFEWTQGSVYINSDPVDSLTVAYKAINMLSKIGWFKDSVTSLKVFKIVDWSDFTHIIKQNTNIKEPSNNSIYNDDVFHMYENINKILESVDTKKQDTITLNLPSEIHEQIKIFLDRNVILKKQDIFTVALKMFLEKYTNE